MTERERLITYFVTHPASQHPPIHGDVDKHEAIEEIEKLARQGLFWNQILNWRQVSLELKEIRSWIRGQLRAQAEAGEFEDRPSW